MKWYRFKDEKPDDGLFIYSDGNRFYLGYIKPAWEDSEVTLDGHPHIKDIFELNNSEEIKYWSPIDLSSFNDLLSEDCWIMGEPAKNELSSEQDIK